MPSQHVRTNNVIEIHGIAAADFDPNNPKRELAVYPEELLPMMQGKIAATNQTNEFADPSGGVNRLKTKNYIIAIYKDEQPNVMQPPLVRKGEQVLLTNYADTDTWYWRSEGRNDNTRRTDQYRIGVGGTLENSPQLNDDNSYFMEFDSRDQKRIRISTSKANGEEFRYLLLIDPGNNTVALSDDVGNIFAINSKEKRVCMKNQDNSLIDLNQKNIVIACEQDITLKSEQGQVNIQSKTHLGMETNGTFAIDYKGGSGSCNAHGGMLTLTGGRIDVKQG